MASALFLSLSVYEPHLLQKEEYASGSGGPGASLVAYMAKNLPAIHETQVRSLSWEDPLEQGMATHSSILAWRISWREEPGGLQSMKSDTTERLTRSGDPDFQHPPCCAYLGWLLDFSVLLRP